MTITHRLQFNSQTSTLSAHTNYNSLSAHSLNEMRQGKRDVVGKGKTKKGSSAFSGRGGRSRGHGRMNRATRQDGGKKSHRRACYHNAPTCSTDFCRTFCPCTLPCHFFMPSSARHLSPSPSLFFHRFANTSSTISSSPQTTLSLQAIRYSYNASLNASKAKRKQDGGMAWAHALA
jgi:hypothetical protein